MAVRREKVVLDLEDNFSTGMARAAAAAGLLDGRLRDLDGSHTDLRRSTDGSVQGIDRFRRSVDQSGPAIDRYSGRMALMAKAGLVLGPSLVPIAAVGIPAVTGLASQLGFAAIGMGSLVVASQGVGDALKAVNEAAIEPTSANLEKAREAMAKLAPEAQAFVSRLQELRPVLDDIRGAAAAGWFPGLTEALNDFESLAPRVADIFQVVGEAGGQLVAEGVEALSGPEWSQFIAFVQQEAPGALEDLGRSVGNVTRGMAELWMAFAPLNSQFSDFLLEASRGFAAWADGLAETEGFQDFVAYIQSEAPQVRDTLSAIAEAVVAIVKAASPLGGPVLAAFEVIADTLKTIADSPAGSRIFTMAAAFVVLNKALAVTAGLMARAGFVGAAGAIRGVGPGGTGAGPIIAPTGTGARSSFAQYRADLRALNSATSAQIRASRTLAATQARVNAQTRLYGVSAAKGAAGVGAFAVATGSVGQGLGLQNTAMLGLVGTMAGPWGAAVGASIGLAADISAKNKKWAETQREVNDAVKSGDLDRINASLETAQKRLEKLQDTSKSDGGFWDFITDNLGAVDGVTAAEGVDSKISKTEKEILKLERAAQNVVTTQSRVRSLARDKAVEEWAYSAGSAFIDLADDMQAPETSLRDLIKRMREQGRAAREMGKNLRAAIRLGADPTALQELIEKLGPEAGLALRQLVRGGRKAAGEFNAAWGVSVRGLRNVEGAIMRVGTAIGRLPDGTVIRVNAEIQDAQARLRSIRQEAQSVAGDYRVNFIVTQTNRINKPPAPLPGQSADGSTVPKDGGPYRDRYPYLLAPGEEVISNRYGQADRHRGLLKAINAGALADGGTAVRPVKVAPAAMVKAHTQLGIDYDRLAQAVTSAQSGGLRMAVDLKTPWGTQTVEGIARTVAREEIDQDKTWSRTQ